MVKKLIWDQAYEYIRKGNEKQFVFNDNLNDRIEMASTYLAKLKLTNEQEATALKAATKEFKEGAKVIHAWQKLICITDRSKPGWQVVEVYNSDKLTLDDEDTKCLEKTPSAWRRHKNL